MFAKSGLESIRLPFSLRVVEDSCFWSCRDLKSVEFSEGLEQIESDAFANTGLESVNLPASLRKLAQRAFGHCESLKSARMKPGLEVLGTDQKNEDGKMVVGVFYGSALESVELPPTLRVIGNYAFGECQNLKAVELPDGLERI